MAHHKRKRPKHRRSGCLLCKPQKLTANVKAERRKTTRAWALHERAALERSLLVHPDEVAPAAWAIPATRTFVFAHRS